MKTVNLNPGTCGQRYTGDARSGMVMMAMMILFGSITLLSVGAFIISSTDVLVAGQYARSKGAFFQAEAGLQSIKAMINDDLASGTLVLTNTVATVNYTAPAGFDFDPVTALVPLAKKDAYFFTITGRTFNAETVLEAAFERQNKLMRLGIFGDHLARGQPNGDIYSYYSESNPNPVPADSTGEATVGSNIEIGLKSSLLLDGNLILGQDSLGNDASIFADAEVPFDYLDQEIPSDPLGAGSGELDAVALFFSDPANNNNADAVPPISNNRVNGSISLPAGNYYIRDFNLGANQVLEVGGTRDRPVRIFFNGSAGNEFRMQPNSQMIFTDGPAVPPAFQLYAVSGSDIRIQPRLDFHGLIYAPGSEVRLQPNGGIYGAFWGDDILVQPGGNIWIDMSLLDQFITDVVEYTQWKEVREPY